MKEWNGEVHAEVPQVCRRGACRGAAEAPQKCCRCAAEAHAEAPRRGDRGPLSGQLRDEVIVVPSQVSSGTRAPLTRAVFTKTASFLVFFSGVRAAFARRGFSRICFTKFYPGKPRTAFDLRGGWSS